MENKIYSFLGLAAKAGKLISGEDSCERLIKSKKVFLIVVASDASDNTKKKMNDMCSYRSIPMKYFGEKSLLGRYIGKEQRAVIAVTGREFAHRLVELLDSSDTQNGGGLDG